MRNGKRNSRESCSRGCEFDAQIFDFFPRIPAWENMGIRAHFFAKRKIRWQKVNFNISLAILRGDYQFRALFGLGKRRLSAFPSLPREEIYLQHRSITPFPFSFPYVVFPCSVVGSIPKAKGFFSGGWAGRQRGEENPV